MQAIDDPAEKLCSILALLLYPVGEPDYPHDKRLERKGELKHLAAAFLAPLMGLFFSWADSLATRYPNVFPAPEVAASPAANDDGHSPLWSLAYSLADGDPIRIAAIFDLPAALVLNTAEYALHLKLRPRV
jgi:hypothetical protein